MTRGVSKSTRPRGAAGRDDAGLRVLKPDEAVGETTADYRVGDLAEAQEIFPENSPNGNRFAAQVFGKE